jgi:hypothetical protein
MSAALMNEWLITFFVRKLGVQRDCGNALLSYLTITFSFCDIISYFYVLYFLVVIYRCQQDAAKEGKTTC